MQGTDGARKMTYLVVLFLVLGGDGCGYGEMKDVYLVEGRPGGDGGRSEGKNQLEM
jgi:hypothetical protein